MILVSWKQGDVKKSFHFIITAIIVKILSYFPKILIYHIMHIYDIYRANMLLTLYSLLRGRLISKKCPFRKYSNFAFRFFREFTDISLMMTIHHNRTRCVDHGTISGFLRTIPGFLTIPLFPLQKSFLSLWHANAAYYTINIIYLIRGGYVI